MPMSKLKAEPKLKIPLTAFLVVRFQSTLNKNTTAKDGAKKPSTAWKILNKFCPFILSIAIAINTANTQPTTIVILPILICCLILAAGFIFFTYTSVVNTVLNALSDEPMVPTNTAINTQITNPFMPEGNKFVTIVIYARSELPSCGNNAKHKMPGSINNGSANTFNQPMKLTPNCPCSKFFAPNTDCTIAWSVQKNATAATG